jgi:hypothetical protein
MVPSAGVKWPRVGLATYLYFVPSFTMFGAILPLLYRFNGVNILSALN